MDVKVGDKVKINTEVTALDESWWGDIGTINSIDKASSEECYLQFTSFTRKEITGTPAIIWLMPGEFSLYEEPKTLIFRQSNL